jgi:hypothetical protein
MNKIIESDVVVYHDETEIDGKIKGHVLLFVPIITTVKEKEGLFGDHQFQVNPLNNLFREIENIRGEFKTDHKFHFSEISGKKWAKRNYADKKLVETGVRYLRQNIGYCKLGIIFYENPSPRQIENYGGKDKREKELRFGETVLRMLLKGSVHYLYNNDHRVRILKIVTDGQPYHRKLDEFRILEKLMEEIRDYVEISPDAELIHLFSNHRKYDKDSEKYIHANLLQLADMLLGCSIHACFKDAEVSNANPRINDVIKDKKGIIAYPVKEMLDKRKRGRGFRISSHYKAFTISKAYLNDTGWEFENIMTKEVNISNTGQLILLTLRKVYD